jgi:transcriptional antiterminator RfaH
MLSWYVLLTEPQRENIVQTQLQNQGLNTYLPVARAARIRQGRRAYLPFFPRYIFVQVDLDAVGRSVLKWTPGVTSLVSFDGDPAAVPDVVIALLKERLEAAREQSFGGLKPGDRVRLRQGPLRDLEAVFDRALSPSGRVRVLLNFLGKQRPCEVHFEFLERVSAR